MALTRKLLTTMGIEADKIDEIITAHSETVSALKEEISKYKKDAEKLPKVEKELNKLKVENNGENPYEAKYTKLKKDFDDYKNDVETKEILRNKANAYKKLLKSANIDEKRFDSIIKVTDLKSLDLDENGNFKNADELKNSISSEWSDFVVELSKRGANTETPPANGGKGKTLDEIKAIKNTAERQQAYKDYYNNERK